MDALNWLAESALTASPEGHLHFGNPKAEALAAIEGAAVMPLPQIGSIHVVGADAQAFLQGQLSNDISALQPGRAQLSSYNSPKGRVLNVFTGLRFREGVLLETSAELVAGTLKRLKMFVLRSKVQLADLRESLPALGIVGPQATDALASIGFEVPAEDWAVTHLDEAFILRRPGLRPRFSVHAPPAMLRELWSRLRAGHQAAGPDAWRLLEIVAGIPTVTDATQDHFVAQMLNLDTLGGISFTKGCYTGQEVVARLHYLGSVKRRMLLAFSEATMIAAGTSVVLESGDAQAVGEVLEAAPHPEFGTALLVVMQMQHAQSTQLRIGNSTGEKLEIQNAGE